MLSWLLIIGATYVRMVMEDDNGDLLADSHNILNRWKNYFSKLLNYLINGRSRLLYQFTKRAIKLTVIIIVGYHFYQPQDKEQVESSCVFDIEPSGSMKC
jgi:hypothetical protein